MGQGGWVNLCGSKGAYNRPSYPCHYCTYRGRPLRQGAVDKAKADDQRHAGERQHHHLKVRKAVGGKQRKIVHDTLPKDVPVISRSKAAEGSWLPPANLPPSSSSKLEASAQVPAVARLVVFANQRPVRNRWAEPQNPAGGPPFFGEFALYRAGGRRARYPGSGDKLLWTNFSSGWASER